MSDTVSDSNLVFLKHDAIFDNIIIHTLGSRTDLNSVKLIIVVILSNPYLLAQNVAGWNCFVVILESIHAIVGM